MKLIIAVAVLALILREALSLIRDNKRQKESISMSREVESINDKIREDRSFMRDLEREQRRQARDAEMERVRQEKLWEEQKEKNAKYEERLFKLEQKLELAARDEEHWSEEASAIRIDMAGLEGYINYCKAKGLLCKGKEEELRKLNNKLYAAETKLIKARQARELCEMQMSA